MDNDNKLVEAVAQHTVEIKNMKEDISELKGQTKVLHDSYLFSISLCFLSLQ